MQPQNPNNYWQPGDQPQPTAPQPQPVAPVPVAPLAPIAAPVVASQTPVAPQAPMQPQPTAQQPQLQSQEQEMDESSQDQEDPASAVNWQAKEYIHQEKNGLWFAVFTVVIIVLMAAAVLLMKSWSFAILLVVIAIVIIVFAKRPPRVMSYSLTNKGLHIGDTLHAFKDFKSFGVVRDGEEYSVMLIPTKRFLPGVTVYFPEESGEEIVDMLGSRLPMQDLRLDWLDRFVRKLRL